MGGRLLKSQPSLASRGARAALRAMGLHPNDSESTAIEFRGGTALCIATNHAVLDVGVPTGLFASELTVPYYAFLDAGMRVDVASPLGGIVPVDPLSVKAELRTAEDDRMLDDGELRSKLHASLAVSSIDFTAYDIVYFAGGWGAAFDLGQSDEIGAGVSAAHAAGRVIGGICHGPLGLLRARNADGSPFVKGRRLTAVTDRQIHQLGIDITPLHPESALRGAGALFEGKQHWLRDFFANQWVADGDLITGQNQNAGPMVARLMLQRALSNRGRRAA